MKITKMTPSKRVADRYYLDLEDGSQLRVNVALIADYSLYTGRDLTEAELASLQKAASSAGARARALRMLGARSMSRRELVTRLQQKGETWEDAEAAADWMERIGALDDETYAAMVVRHYGAKGYGVARIRGELQRRGIPRELWEEALEQKPPAEDALERLLAAKLAGKRLDDPREVKRATDSLLRRGFSWEEVRSALEKYKTNIEDIEEWQ